MEDEGIGSIEKFQSFDLGERGGGTQIIIDYRVIRPSEYYVMTLGGAPKIDAISDVNNGKKEEEGENIKIRFFKLIMQEGSRYSVAEFVTVKSIAKVASMFINP